MASASLMFSGWQITMMFVCAGVGFELGRIGVRAVLKAFAGGFLKWAQE